VFLCKVCFFKLLALGFGENRCLYLEQSAVDQNSPNESDFWGKPPWYLLYKIIGSSNLKSKIGMVQKPGKLD
jgi:hypothetical protein